MMPASVRYDQEYFARHESHMVDFDGVCHGIATAIHQVYGGTCRTVLEVGCGRGYITKHLAGFFPLVVGLDISEWAISHPIQDGLVLVRRDLTEGLPMFLDKAFDLVLSWQTLEHLPNDEGDVNVAVDELGRVARWFQLHSIYLAPPESPTSDEPAHTLVCSREWWRICFQSRQRREFQSDDESFEWLIKLGRWEKTAAELFCLRRV